MFAVAIKATCSREIQSYFTLFFKIRVKMIDNDSKHQTRPNGCDKENQFNG